MVDLEGLKSLHKHECEATRLVANPDYLRAAIGYGITLQEAIDIVDLARRHRMRNLQDEIDQWDEWKGHIWQAIPSEAFKAMVTIVNTALGVNERVEDTDPQGDEQ